MIVLTCAAALLASAPNDVRISGESPVADAAMNRDAETVRALLRQGGDVNAAQGDGMTALHWAAIHQDVAVMDMLLYAGANVSATTRLGAFTPLLVGAKTGNPDVVRALVDASADVNTTNSLGTTPLMVAAASGSVEAVQLLLDRGATVDATEPTRERTALMFAAAYDRHEVVALLAKSGADVHAATKVIDIKTIEKEWSEAHRARRKKRLEDANAKAIADAKARGEEPPVQEAAPEPKKDRGVFAKVFGFLPGVGGEKEESTNRRRFFRTPEGELVGGQGGVTALHLAARQGNRTTVDELLVAGADVNELSGGDHTSPLLIATINGHFDLAKSLLDRGADPNLASDAGATPLYGAINLQWAPKALYPQPTAYQQQALSYLEYMETLLKAGADPNARLKKKVWYSGYNFDLSGVDESGATPFWRAAYGTDVDAMKLLVAYGGEPHVPSVKPGREPQGGIGPTDEKDVSGLPPVPVGGPSVTPLLAAAGVGYGEGFAANSHRHHPAGFLPAVKYLVEELGADVNARDHAGYNALHNAASRGDTEMIQYLADKGCDVMAVSREGQTTADMANGPVQRVQPFPEALALLESLGSVNNDNCVSC